MSPRRFLHPARRSPRIPLRAGQEDVILKIASAYEAASKRRILPPPRRVAAAIGLAG
jgi:hypothetical protein